MVEKAKKTPRKIVQIAASSESGNSCVTLFALCDDGELFIMPFGVDFDWIAVTPIPQGGAQ